MIYKYILRETDGRWLGARSDHNAVQAVKMLLGFNLARQGKELSGNLKIEPIGETTFRVLYEGEEFLLEMTAAPRD